MTENGLGWGWEQDWTAAGNLSGFWTSIGKLWKDQLLEKVLKEAFIFSPMITPIFYFCFLCLIGNVYLIE